ncbi:hypothetical protein F4677DRAFT_235672 [Hypoxylon crocopeplum]|nr:hypothetical protein F4677DRAFT_235672 [Hypoxylon crocopeplum]
MASPSFSTVSTWVSDGIDMAAVRIYTYSSGVYVFNTEDWWAYATVSASGTGSPITQTSTGASAIPTPSNRAPSSSSSVINLAQTTQPASSSGISRGATAGIAIACVIVGLVLGIIAGFVLFRRRRQRGPQPMFHADEYDNQEKPLRDVLPADKLSLDQFLLDSTSDAEIGTELRSLGHLLQQHVENNYHLLPVSRSSNELSTALINLGIDQGGTISATQLASLALEPKTRYLAIQHVIAKVTFGSVVFGEASPSSLLPQPVSSFASMIPPTESRRGNPEAVNSALTRWRQLSAFLLHAGRSDRTPLTPSEDISTHQAQQLAVALNEFLGPFVAGDRQDRYEQENHLREVMVECATFGYLLFSQPSEYRFRFDGGRPNNIAVCPGLDKISDEEGRRYPPAQPVVAPVTESF